MERDRLSPYFEDLAVKLDAGEYVPCRFCSTALTLWQLLNQYEMCEQHWESFCRRRWPERYAEDEGE